MRKKLHSRWAVLVLVLIVPACTSRTTPLPPPEVNTVSRPSGVGDVTVVGLALEGASVAVINERTLEGTITTPEQAGCRSVCEFHATLRADSGDALRVWQFFETEGGIEADVP
ncbi:MAG TPA: hypothetical protein VFN67_13990 [Polyangiales bacterium]|jgi:hypothetical protein|nr:hypothetical protein [Polyangiales bacterium]